MASDATAPTNNNKKKNKKKNEATTTTTTTMTMDEDEGEREISIDTVHRILAHMSPGATTKELESRRKEIFRYYDKNHNGELEEKELEAMLKDMYLERVSIAEKGGASKRWAELARQQAEEESGHALFRKGVAELLALRDANKNNKLDWEEFSKEISREETLFRNANRYWRLAPLADIPLYVDELANGPFHIWKIMSAGATAGVLGKTVASPLSRLTILMQTGGIQGAPTDAVGLTRHILRTDGLRGLMRGNAADILRQVPYAGSQYIAYENLKQRLSGTGLGKTPERMISGGLAGAASIALTYPLDMVRARMAIQTSDNLKYKSILHAFRRIYAEEGGEAFYRGCGTAIAERFPNMAINFGAYELFKSYMNDVGIHGIVASLLCGGLAGIISTTACFPLDLIMRNLQTGSGRQTPFQVMRHIYSNSGLRGFYRGLTPQIIKILPYTCTVWIVYDRCKQFMHFEVR
mmetsp:Transcript_29974/g.58601  ORF Transcript_29974/g.58601 Transcript_29974/m.58601 type:complete len:466 (-) Transcript_29974:113-1510(-)